MGFFKKNCSKPGPGVSKNAPRKKRFFLFWEIFGRKFSKIVQVNLLFVLFCIPIVTIGPATAAYTYVLRNFAREEHAFVWWDFIDAFKSNFKQAFAAGLIDIAVTALFAFDVFFYITDKAPMTVGRYLLLAFSITAFILCLFARFHLYTIMVTFDLKLKYIYKNSFIFAILGLKNNICALLAEAATLLVFVGSLFLMAFVITNGNIFQIFLIIWILFILLILPAFMRFIAVFATYPTIVKYMMPKTDEREGEQSQSGSESESDDISDEDAELLIGDDDEEDDEEIIFHDEIE